MLVHELVKHQGNVIDVASRRSYALSETKIPEIDVHSYSRIIDMTRIKIFSQDCKNVLESIRCSLKRQAVDDYLKYGF